MVGVGWLEGWRLTFSGGDQLGWEGAVTTIVESEGDNAGTYQKLHVRVATLDGDVTAYVYVYTGYEGGLPTAWYLAEIARAAEQAGAPADYVESLRSRPTRTASA
jgi:hypothetical protein